MLFHRGGGEEVIYGKRGILVMQLKQICAIFP